MSKYIFCMIRCLRLFVEFISGILFKLIYSGSSHKELPPITNLLLLDSATSLATKIREQKVTSEKVVRAFIDRIKDINPILNCVVDDRFEEALNEAREIDNNLRNNAVNKEQIAKETPFLGVPFTIKDCFKVKGLRQTAGLYARKNFIAESDAEVVKLMKDAGGIILCVTNVSELCMWWESSNTVYGRTNNPYDTNRIVGGSSGGEGCIQAACGSPIGIGSDIGGSIRMPSFFNGIFGHKPSSGVVNNSGQEPVAVGNLERMLSTGPMCRHATDLTPALKVLSAGNAALLNLDTKPNLKSLRVFYIEDDGGSAFTTPVCSELKAAMKAVVSHLNLAHGVTATKLKMKKLRNTVPAYFVALSSEPEACTFSQEMVLKKGSLNAFTELFKWLLGFSKHTLAGLFLCILEKLDSNEDPRKPRLTSLINNIRTELKETLGEDGVLLYPSHPTLAPYHNQPLCRAFNFSYTALFNMLGLPVTQCPLGLSKNRLPLGIQVVANHHQDRLCLFMAEVLEKGFGGWVCPSVIE